MLAHNEPLGTGSLNLIMCCVCTRFLTCIMPAKKICFSNSQSVCKTRDFIQNFYNNSTRAGGHPSDHVWMANEEANHETCKRTCRQFLGMRRHAAGMPLRMFDWRHLGIRQAEVLLSSSTKNLSSVCLQHYAFYPANCSP